MRERIAPFLALLDARYMPLIFVVSPQAYAVYTWLIMSAAPAHIAFMGAVGYEFIYVGAIAWAEAGHTTVWTWITAGAALGFSMGVAYYVYEPLQHGWAWLHVGFPMVAFAYTMQMYAAGAHKSLSAPVAVRRPVPPTPAPTPASAPRSSLWGKLRRLALKRTAPSATPTLVQQPAAPTPAPAPTLPPSVRPFPTGDIAAEAFTLRTNGMSFQKIAETLNGKYTLTLNKANVFRMIAKHEKDLNDDHNA